MRGLPSPGSTFNARASGVCRFIRSILKSTLDFQLSGFKNAADNIGTSTPLLA